MDSQKIALVTGANRGIGLEICHQLARQEYRVILTSRSEVIRLSLRSTLSS